MANQRQAAGSHQTATARMITRSRIFCDLRTTDGLMIFAKVGAGMGLPWWIYYGVPAFLTWVLPPVIVQTRFRETTEYLAWPR